MIDDEKLERLEKARKQVRDTVAALAIDIQRDIVITLDRRMDKIESHIDTAKLIIALTERLTVLEAGLSERLDDLCRHFADMQSELDALKAAGDINPDYAAFLANSRAKQTALPEAAGPGDVLPVGSIRLHCAYDDDDFIDCVLDASNATATFGHCDDIPHTIVFRAEKAQQMADWWTSAAAWLRKQAAK